MTALSICMGTGDPPERVAAALAPLRGLRVDGVEVVLALDDRTDRALDENYAAVADRILRFPYRDPPERVQPWLHQCCAGRWVLRLDADEVPSVRLREEVEEVVGSEGLTHAWIPRRWLWPDSESALVNWPWRPDYQLRLFRNDPAVVRLSGAMHSFAHAEGARRYMTAPIYHADLLLNSYGARTEKARRYADVRPGLRAAGRELNVAYYLPEQREEAVVEPVLAADRATIRALFFPPPVGRRFVQVERGTSAEIDALWDAAPLREEDYRARLELLERDLTIFLDEVRTFDTRATNLGDRRWPWGLSTVPQVRLAHRWWRDGVAVEGLRTPLPHTVRPGETAIVPVQVGPPPGAGVWTLELDLVHEHVRWFACPITVTVDCRAP